MNYHRKNEGLIRSGSETGADGIPASTICLGMQEMNVGNGGGILPDLGELTPYHQRSGGDQFHRAVLKADSRLAAIFGCRELLLNSCHHQAVDPENREKTAYKIKSHNHPDGLDILFFRKHRIQDSPIRQHRRRVVPEEKNPRK